MAPADGIMVERLRRAGAHRFGLDEHAEFGLGSTPTTKSMAPRATPDDAEPQRRRQQRRRRRRAGAAHAARRRRRRRRRAANPPARKTSPRLRPSFGRVPSDAARRLPSMGVLGPMARSVPDLALLLGAKRATTRAGAACRRRRPRSRNARLDPRLQRRTHRLVRYIHGPAALRAGCSTPAAPGARRLRGDGCIVEEAIRASTLTPSGAVAHAARMAGGSIFCIVTRRVDAPAQ